MNEFILAPSILSADFARLGEQVRQAVTAGARYVHIDVMDGRFVPNITIGPLVVKALRPLATELDAVLDVHLMIENPDKYIADFAEAGADIITVHVETCPHLHRTIQAIHEQGYVLLPRVQHPLRVGFAQGSGEGSKVRQAQGVDQVDAATARELHHAQRGPLPCGLELGVQIERGAFLQLSHHAVQLRSAVDQMHPPSVDQNRGATV